MTEKNKGTNSLEDKDFDSSLNNDKSQLNNTGSTGLTSDTGQLSGDTVTVQGTTFTREEIEQANKPQPNVILDKVSGPDIELNRDNERVNPRANEASDSTDTNTGGMISGAA